MTAAHARTETSDLRVADLMTIDPVVVSIDAPIGDAEELMRRNHITGLPVVDPAGRVIGVISQTDVLFLDVPAVQILIRHRERGVRVGEVMSTPAVTVDVNASLKDAAIRMSREHIHRLVAVDDSHRPIGVISAMDFVELAAES